VVRVRGARGDFVSQVCLERPRSKGVRRKNLGNFDSILKRGEKRLRASEREEIFKARKSPSGRSPIGEVPSDGGKEYATGLHIKQLDWIRGEGGDVFLSSTTTAERVSNDDHIWEARGWRRVERSLNCGWDRLALEKRRGIGRATE